MIIFYYLHLASFSPIVNNPIRTRELFLGHNPTVVNHMAYVLQILCVKIRGYKTEGQRDKWDIKPAMFQCCSLNTLRTWQALCLTVRKLFQYPEACGFNSTDWQKKKKKRQEGIRQVWAILLWLSHVYGYLKPDHSHLKSTIYACKRAIWKDKRYEWDCSTVI